MTPVLVMTEAGLTVGLPTGGSSFLMTPEGLTLRFDDRVEASEVFLTWADVAWIRLDVPLARGRWPVARSWASQLVLGALGLWDPAEAPRIAAFVSSGGRVLRVEAPSGAVGGHAPMAATQAQRLVDAVIASPELRPGLADPAMVDELLLHGRVAL